MPNSPNHSLLKARWPELATAIAKAPLAKCEDRSKLVPSMACEGLLLRSAYAPKEEAALQASRVPEDAKKVTVYGLGMGDLPRFLLANPLLLELKVVLLNLSVARAVLESSHQEDWLQDPRVCLQYSPEQRLPEEPFCAVPPCLQLADPSNFALRDALSAKLQEPFIAGKWSEREAVLRKHIKANETLVALDTDVGELFDTRRGEKFLVVGPGPSLSGGMERIRALHPSSVLVAISTSLQPLITAGLQPDFVVMIDSHSINPLQDSQHEAFRNIPLVYVPDVQTDTLRAWPGPRLVGFLDRPRHARLNTIASRGVLWTQGTVAHTAVDFAVRCGASQVTLFGLDFGYPGGASHAEGTPDYQAAGSGDIGRTLLDGYGQRIASDPNLISYLRDLEEYVARHPNVQFLRADKTGAAMEGIEWLTD